MKYIKIIAFLVSIAFLFACGSNVENNATAKTVADHISKIEVIDFHSTHRCKTCNAIEANTSYTLNTFFSKELENGDITFRIINVDKKENESMAEKFEATGTALFLNVIHEGQESQINLTDFAFMKGNDKADFSETLKLKIEDALLSI